MFGTTTYGMQPDIMTLSKQLSSSYQPISALLINERVYGPLADESEKIGTFGHGFTASGHPVAAAVAHLVVSIRCLLDPRLVVLGGGLGSRAEIADAVRHEVGLLAHRPVEVRISRLGPRAATVGALGLALTRATTPR